MSRPDRLQSASYLPLPHRCHTGQLALAMGGVGCGGNGCFPLCASLSTSPTHHFLTRRLSTYTPEGHTPLTWTRSPQVM
ncbi:hypothetical protein SKAU_G00290420 [Synaphobranchus kaupii]|uniref:Uncharacterized protein n=1 Tax=Synaphobranchus kaupii TaxID=118154 RepID=A0A9Q1IM14_SYNKA|nr:hypothetical protein SKAU_G00290420 [Synaphobranchus kaupii]